MLKVEVIYTRSTIWKLDINTNHEKNSTSFVFLASVISENVSHSVVSDSLQRHGL